MIHILVLYEILVQTWWFPVRVDAAAVPRAHREGHSGEERGGCGQPGGQGHRAQEAVGPGQGEGARTFLSTHVLYNYSLTLYQIYFNKCVGKNSNC